MAIHLVEARLDIVEAGVAWRDAVAQGRSQADIDLALEVLRQAINDHERILEAKKIPPSNQRMHWRRKRNIGW